MMEILRQRAIAAGHSGVIPAEEKLQSLISPRYEHPVFDGTSIRELAQRCFTAGAHAVLGVFADQASLQDIAALRSMDRLRATAGKAGRRG